MCSLRLSIDDSFIRFFFFFASSFFCFVCCFIFAFVFFFFRLRTEPLSCNQIDRLIKLLKWWMCNITHDHRIQQHIMHDSWWNLILQKRNKISEHRWMNETEKDCVSHLLTAKTKMQNNETSVLYKKKSNKPNGKTDTHTHTETESDRFRKKKEHHKHEKKCYKNYYVIPFNIIHLSLTLFFIFLWAVFFVVRFVYSLCIKWNARW